MRRVRRKVFPCGHKGFGQLCHRCAQAGELDAWAEHGTGRHPALPHDGHEPPSAEEAQAEAERLRAVQDSA